MKGKGLISLAVIFVILAAVGVYFTKINPALKYMKEGLDLKGGVQVVLQATKPVTPTEMEDARNIIAFRANSFGVSEPIIQIQGKNQISVQLPGIKHQQAAINAIGQTAQLIFKGPDGKTIVTGADLKSASAQLSGTGGGGAVVQLSFDAKGAKLFGAATARDVGKNISIYLDKTNLETAQVKTPIPNGQAQITGIPSLAQAQRLATLINSGALPVPMKILEANTVSAQLGAASIHASEIAGILAMILIAVFMLVFYRFGGFLADMALAFYLMLLLFILIQMKFVMTLPSVAGIILSAGIAVDANVIIFARLREELRAGKPVGSAIDAGFRNAFRAILDSNVSTIIASVVLYYVGSQDVRGFAVTLGLGVAISFLTAVVFTRYLLRFAEDSILVRNVRAFLGSV